MGVPNKYHPPGKMALPCSPQFQEVLEKVSHSRAPSPIKGKADKRQRQLAEAQRNRD